MQKSPPTGSRTSPTWYFESTPLRGLVTLRGGCKAWNEHAAKLITHHLILKEDGVVRLRTGQAPQVNFRFLAAQFPRCFTDDFPFSKHTKVLDLAGPLIPQAARLLYAWPQPIDTVRVLSSCTDVPDIPAEVRRIVYFGPADVKLTRNGPHRVVLHLRRPAKCTAGRDMYLGLRSASEVVVVLHPWESPAVDSPAPANDYALHEHIKSAMWTGLGHLDAILHVAYDVASEGLDDDGEQDPYTFRQDITIVSLERMDPATFGLRPEWIAGRWFAEN